MSYSDHKYWEAEVGKKYGRVKSRFKKDFATREEAVAAVETELAGRGGLRKVENPNTGMVTWYDGDTERKLARVRDIRGPFPVDVLHPFDAVRVGGELPSSVGSEAYPKTGARDVHTVPEALRAVRELVDRTGAPSTKGDPGGDRRLNLAIFVFAALDRRDREPAGTHSTGAGARDVGYIEMIPAATGGWVAGASSDAPRPGGYLVESTHRFGEDVLDAIHRVSDALKQMPGAARGWGRIGAHGVLAKAALGVDESLAHVRRAMQAAGHDMDGAPAPTYIPMSERTRDAVLRAAADPGAVLPYAATAPKSDVRPWPGGEVRTEADMEARSAWYREQQESPPQVPEFPVGALRIGRDGVEVEELRSFRADDLRYAEAEKRGPVVEKYVRWVEAGSAVPPLQVIEVLPHGSGGQTVAEWEAAGRPVVVQVRDGHHRLAALARARRGKRTRVLAWVGVSVVKVLERTDGLLVPHPVGVSLALARELAEAWGAGRDAALERARRELFTDEEGNHIDVGPKPAQETPAENMRRRAAELRALAARGMSVRKFTKEAERLEAEAARSEAGA